MSALFGAVAAAVDKAPESFDVYQLGALYTAAALVPEAKLPEQVGALGSGLSWGFGLCGSALGALGFVGKELVRHWCLR